MELPLDIQGHIWKMYFRHHVIPEFMGRNLTTDYGPYMRDRSRYDWDHNDVFHYASWDVYYKVYVRWGLRNHKWGLRNEFFNITPRVVDDYDLMYAKYSKEDGERQHDDDSDDDNSHNSIIEDGDIDITDECYAVIAERASRERGSRSGPRYKIL
jgi:hypothetical protein